MSILKLVEVILTMCDMHVEQEQCVHVCDDVKSKGKKYIIVVL